ncbi:hypothetical protein [Thermophilibacter provencensis]|uniref:hypothetical protein n=1 Tax=Thermophilibacter provencensis TaxID=1852386 RepID=UPI003AA992D6
MRPLTTVRLAAALAAALALPLMGCSAPGRAAQPTEGAAQGAPGATTPLDGASAMGLVIDIDDEGLVVRPDEGDAETGVISLQENGSERRFDYAEGCEFSVIAGSSSADATEGPASKSDIKKDSTVCVWLNGDGLAEKVSILRTGE